MSKFRQFLTTLTLFHLNKISILATSQPSLLVGPYFLVFNLSSYVVRLTTWQHHVPPACQTSIGADSTLNLPTSADIVDFGTPQSFIGFLLGLI